MNAIRIIAIATAVVMHPHVSAHAADRVENIRPRDPYASLLLEFGMRGSETFRQLIRDLDWSNVIVYIDVRQDPHYPLGGSLTFMGSSDGWRWLRATIDVGTTDHGAVLEEIFYLTETLGHELQHAREVTAAPSMGSLSEFEALFRTLGRSVGERSFDTAMANEIGRVVAAELRTRETRVVSDPPCHGWW